MNQAPTLTVAAWLQAIETVSNVRNVRVTIGKESWEGCEFDQTVDSPEGCQKPGPVTKHGIYLVGSRPKAYIRNSHQAYLLGDKVWYPASYLTAMPSDPEIAAMHPFGINWILAPWEEDQPLDAGESHPYHRTPFAIEYV